MMTHEEKAAEYRRIAGMAVDYIATCAERRVVPLKRDADLMMTEILRTEKARIG